MWFLLNNNTKQHWLYKFTAFLTILYPLCVIDKNTPNSLWKKAQCRKTKWNRKISQLFKDDEALCRSTVSLLSSIWYYVYINSPPPASCYPFIRPFSSNLITLVCPPPRIWFRPWLVRHCKFWRQMVGTFFRRFFSHVKFEFPTPVMLH